MDMFLQVKPAGAALCGASASGRDSVCALCLTSVVYTQPVLWHLCVPCGFLEEASVPVLS